jgi:hypothetical protein
MITDVAGFIAHNCSTQSPAGTTIIARGVEHGIAMVVDPWLAPT